MIEYRSKQSLKELPFQVDQKMGSSSYPTCQDWMWRALTPQLHNDLSCFSWKWRTATPEL